MTSTETESTETKSTETKRTQTGAGTTGAEHEFHAATGIRVGQALVWRPARPWGASSAHVHGRVCDGQEREDELALALDVDRSLPHDVRSRARASWLHGRVLAYEDEGSADVLVVPGTIMSLALMGEALRRHRYGHEDRLSA